MAQAGLEITDEEWAQKHYITKNFEKIEMNGTENGEGENAQKAPQ